MSPPFITGALLFAATQPETASRKNRLMYNPARFAPAGAGKAGIAVAAVSGARPGACRAFVPGAETRE